MNQLLTAETVAQILNVSKPKVYELARSILPARVVVRLGRRVRFNQAALEEWILAGGYRIPGESRPREIDRLIHEPLRLAIVNALAGNESLPYKDLKNLVNTSDGNLSAHTRKLDQAGYITCKKIFKGRFPQTIFGLTAVGRDAFENYLDLVSTMLKQMRKRATCRREIKK